MNSSLDSAITSAIRSFVIQHPKGPSTFRASLRRGRVQETILIFISATSTLEMHPQRTGPLVFPVPLPLAKRAIGTSTAENTARIRNVSL